MFFNEVRASLLQVQRLSSRACERPCAFDDCDDLHAARIEARRVVVHAEERGLVWTGDTVPVFRHAVRTPAPQTRLPILPYFPATSRAAFRSGSLENTTSSPPWIIQRCRTIPCISMRKKAGSATPCLARVGLPDSPPYCRVTCISGKSLRRGYGRWSDSAKVFCEKGWFVLILRIWTFSAWNWG
jgi:hypothetical protein